MIPFISKVIFSGNQVATLLAGFIVVTAVVPLKNTTTHLTAKLFPRIQQRLILDNLELYRTQLKFIWVDKKITEKEQKLLTALRSSLGISEKEHKRVEQEILGYSEK